MTLTRWSTTSNRQTKSRLRFLSGNFSSRVYSVPREIVRSCNVHTAYAVLLKNIPSGFRPRVIVETNCDIAALLPRDGHSRCISPSNHTDHTARVHMAWWWRRHIQVQAVVQRRKRKEETKNYSTLASLEVARGVGAKPSTEPAAAINARAATLLTHAIGYVGSGGCKQGASPKYGPRPQANRLAPPSSPQPGHSVILTYTTPPHTAGASSNKTSDARGPVHARWRRITLI